MAYESELDVIMRTTDAAVGVLLLLGAERGDGVAVALALPFATKRIGDLAQRLREVADQVESDIESGYYGERSTG